MGSYCLCTAIARKHLIDDAQPGCYHLISRCVRRALVCGDAAEHRRAWLDEQVRVASEACAVEVLTHAVMSNHFHLVVRTDPEAAIGWSAVEVAERWCHLYPKGRDEDGRPIPYGRAAIEAVARDETWVDVRRRRLATVSWFMKAIKERIARRANREDGVTGHFWEGRFQSVPLLDQAAVVACMAYVDLNPIRAGIADRPETSDHTGIKRRIQQRQRHRKAIALLENPPALLSAELRRQAEQTRDRGPEAGTGLAPIARCAITGEQSVISLDEYFELVDETGRIVRGDKRGAIPAHLRPILERLDIDCEAWLAIMRSAGNLLGAAIGNAAARAAEAIRRGAKWIVDRTAGLYRRRPATG